jgi:CHAT domain-containing protein
MPGGLDAGEYSLRIDGGGESTAFVVEEPAEAARMLEDANSLAELLGDRHHPLCVQVAVESLLDQRDDDDKPLAYWSDAFDLLEGVPEANDSEYLRYLRDQVGRRLRRENLDKPLAPLQPVAQTGIDVIDRARRQIAVGAWRDAWELLAHDLPADSRAQALGKLHRAIIMGQSGRGTTDQAGRLFREALRELRWANDSDRFLAHVNAGNYFLGDAQDQLYNHAFQMAAGNRLSLLSALRSWSEANAAYRQAEPLAETRDASSRAALLVNQARLQLLLADIIRTLDAPDAAGRREFERGEAAAEEMARESARGIEDLAPAEVEPQVRASAAETLAQLAHRRGAESDCREHALRALALYLDAGSLAGAEGVYRLLGLHFRQSSRRQLERVGAGDFATTPPAEEALRHFLISARLAEILRARIPSDRFGLAHAGFFARRAYVNEQIVDLLVAQNRPAEALHHAELAKARSLRDLLASQRGESIGSGDVVGEEAETIRPLKECLEDWPADVAAIEYFLGTEKAWRFVVDTKGEVHASDLLPVGRSPRELVAEVGLFLKGIDGAKSEMRGRLESQRPFDHEWQRQLRDFRQILAPDEVLGQLRQAKTVIVVPHHILHYFPFAALVTECDESRRGFGQMVQPRFLVEESFDLAYAPSLGVWDLLRRRAAPPVQAVSAVGIVDFPTADPLPGVAADLENLKSVFGDRVDSVLFANQASETQARLLLRRPGMVLFATHGANRPLQPLLSYLLCQRDAEHDGRLTAAEIYRLQVGAQLIIMSACYSGLADQSPLPGDDLFGIQRAFLNAGASTIVAGLWQIDDKSGPPLMRGVFEQLARGQTAAAALASAQRQFLQERRVPGAPGEIHLHPFFWAVFAVAGDDRTRCDFSRRPAAAPNPKSTSSSGGSISPPGMASQPHYVNSPR